MSELTECNYCRLKRIRSSAKLKKMKVTVLPDATWGMGGMNVYVHPKNINIMNFADGENGERDKYFRAWFMGLSDHCVC